MSSARVVNTIEARRIWKGLGGTVGAFPGTGEIRFDHPAWPNPLRINGRRKEVPRILMVRINQLKKGSTRWTR